MQDISGGIVAANDNDEFRFYIYAWLYPDGRTFYIGKGQNDRDSVEKYGRNKLFKRIVAKIRGDGGEPRIVRWHGGLRESDAHHLEIAYIKLYGRRDNGTGVLANLTDGGEGVSGLRHSAETIKKMSEAKQGRVFSEETRAKIGAVWLGRRHTKESRAKMSESCRARSADPVYRQKQSSSHTGKNLDTTHKARITSGLRLAGPSPRNTSGFKGVSAYRAQWRADIHDCGKQYFLGYFDTSEEAARAYDKAAVAAWGAGNCYLNFPIAANDDAEREPCKQVS